MAVSTYRGRVHYGLVADAQAVPDLRRLAGALTEEVETLIVTPAAPETARGDR